MGSITGKNSFSMGWWRHIFGDGNGVRRQKNVRSPRPDLYTWHYNVSNSDGEQLSKYSPGLQGKVVHIFDSFSHYRVKKLARAVEFQQVKLPPISTGSKTFQPRENTQARERLAMLKTLGKNNMPYLI